MIIVATIQPTVPELFKLRVIEGVATRSLHLAVARVASVNDDLLAILELHHNSRWLVEVLASILTSSVLAPAAVSTLEVEAAHSIVFLAYYTTAE